MRIAPPRSRADEIRLARGLKPAEMARRANIDPSTLHKILSGQRGVSRHFAEPLAAALTVRPEELFARIGSPISSSGQGDVAEPAKPQGPARGSFLASPLASLLGPVTEPARDAALTRDVPVYGTAEAGAEGAFHLNTGEPIDWARRPAGLAGMQGVFAIYVEGDSMVPWRQPGERVFVHERRPAAPGSHVIAEVWERETGHPPRAFLKRLLRRTATRVELEQYNPAKVITVEAARVGRLYRVIEWEEVQGL
ncbi:MAG: LexA family transcriptional regulator [Acetobacteraceae bacterium]